MSDLASAGTGIQAVALAEALANGSDECMILIAGGSVHAVRHGHPLNEELGLELSDVLADPPAFFDDHDLTVLTEAWRTVTSAPGNIVHATFTIRDAGGLAVQLDGTASNLESTELAAIVVRVRVSRVSTLPAPPGSDSKFSSDPAIQKTQFMQLVQRAVDRKMKRVWKLPKHARSVTRDRRCDYAVVLLNLDRYGMLRGSFSEAQLRDLMDRAAQRLRKALRARDAVAHLGRSELAMFLDGVVDAEQAARVTDAYTRILEDRFEIENESVTLSPVVGIATSEREYERAQDLIQDAAAAVSMAMRRSRTGRQAFQSGIRKEDRRRLILSADLREALKSGDVFEHYQPIIRLETGEVVGFEALCRWHHPTLEQVGPSEFIPVAEEVGLIRQLGNRVLVNACVQTAVWNQARARPITVSVNVSAAEIVHSTFARDVVGVLAETNMDPANLILEVTESALLEDLDAAKANMSELRSRGVQFALDDFGTGYASLAYLVELPFNRLKIDRSLVSNEDDAHRRKVVRAVIALGHELSLSIVAEGVETPSQARELSARSCDYGQGYLFGRAMSVDDATELISED